MALITEQDRQNEFTSICSLLDKLEIAAQILPKNEMIDQACMMISLPTNCSDWSAETETGDLHLTTGYLVQIGEEENQQTKYLMLYMPVQVDVSNVDELTLLRYVNDLGKKFPFGSFFTQKDERTDRLLVQAKYMLGGYVGEELDGGVVGEVIYELGAAYDMIKADLLAMTGQDK